GPPEAFVTCWRPPNPAPVPPLRVNSRVPVPTRARLAAFRTMFWPDTVVPVRFMVRTLPPANVIPPTVSVRVYTPAAGDDRVNPDEVRAMGVVSPHRLRMLPAASDELSSEISDPPSWVIALLLPVPVVLAKEPAAPL